ncbi:hypothetical protein M422DRAFT_74558 [Sphaerobolus stellatus SS14]|nr:hypothetical protein M422DRAFT_74558 [Sphaerobolus stellatus SS14]
MDTENGNDYIKRIASFIRSNGHRLADISLTRGRRLQNAPSSSMLSWIGFGSMEQNTSKPLIFTEDPHHLFYLLMRLEELAIPVGSLDVRVQNLSRPTSMSYLTMLALRDKSDVLSISSLRSTMSSVSMLSLGGWFSRPEPASVESELKFVYSSFTKLPALRVRASGPKMISELADDPPLDSAVPMDAFKILMMLECEDIDPRVLLGWDRLCISLQSLSVKRSGLEDIADLLVDSVIDDKVRREENGNVVGRPRLIHRPSSMRSQRSVLNPTRLPPSVPEDEEQEEPSTEEAQQAAIAKSLPSNAWSQLTHLCFADNNLTFLPSLPPLPSLTSLDLSSNLLVSVPPSLSTLPRLRSLNLAHNMVESVLGIYSQIPSIIVLNLASNRLDSLCGLERLERLSRVDLRENRVEDLEEVGRLAVLGGIKEVWVSGNPCTHRIQDWRVRCFDLFAKENREVILDGGAPGILERRAMAYQVNKNAIVDLHKNGRPLSQAVIPTITVPPSPTPTPESSPSVQPTEPPSRAYPSRTASPALSEVTSSGQSFLQQKNRKRKAKRIVDLNGTASVDEGAANSRPKPILHARHSSEAGLPRRSNTTFEDPKSKLLSAAADIKQASGSSHLKPVTTERRSPQRSTTVDSDAGSPVTRLQETGGARTLSTATKSSKRRARVSPSMFEPSFASMAVTESQAGNSENTDGLSEADRFRQRIEALRNEVGDSWLKVLSQTHLTSPDEVPARRKS